MRECQESAKTSALALATILGVVLTNTEGYKEEPEVHGQQALQGRQLRDRHSCCSLQGLLFPCLSSLLQDISRSDA